MPRRLSGGEKHAFWAWPAARLRWAWAREQLGPPSRRRGAAAGQGAGFYNLDGKRCSCVCRAAFLELPRDQRQAGCARCAWPESWRSRLRGKHPHRAGLPRGCSDRASPRTRCVAVARQRPLRMVPSSGAGHCVRLGRSERGPRLGGVVVHVCGLGRPAGASAYACADARLRCPRFVTYL